MKLADIKAILAGNPTEEQLNDYVKQIKALANETDTVSFAAGVCLEQDSQKIYEAMKTADVRMYEDKKKFYNENPELKRR